MRRKKRERIAWACLSTSMMCIIGCAVSMACKFLIALELFALVGLLTSCASAVAFFLLLSKSE